MGSKENFEATSPADSLRDSQPSNLAAYSMERDETVPSMLAIQRQSLVDKGFLPSLDLDLPSDPAHKNWCPQDPGMDPWRGREIPDIDPGFNPWRGREIPDIDPGFNPWRGREIPDIDPGFNPWRGRNPKDLDPGFEPNDPGFTPSRGRQYPNLDPGFTPGRGRQLPDWSSRIDGWSKPELPAMTPEEWKDLLSKSVPDATKDEIAKAEKAVDKKADVNDGPFPLSEKQQSERKRLDHAILEGNLKEIEAIVRSYKNNPEALRRVLGAVNEDLKDAGIELSWQTGNMMMANDTDFHKVGYLTIYRQGNDRAISMSTDDRIGTAVGGPVSWENGQRIDQQMSMSEDPNRAIKGIANSAVLALTKKK